MKLVNLSCSLSTLSSLTKTNLWFLLSLTESHIKVIRIKEMIINVRSSWLSNTFTFIQIIFFKSVWVWGILVRNPHCRFSLPDFYFFRSFRIHKKLYLRLTKKLQSIVSLSYGRTLIKRKLIGYENLSDKR